MVKQMDEEVVKITLNKVKEYFRFVEGLRKEGLEFKKKVTKFSNSSAAIYLPKRLIGQTFRVLLIPIDDPYELPDLPPEKVTNKILQETEKDLKKIQDENETKIKKLIQ